MDRPLQGLRPVSEPRTSRAAWASRPHRMIFTIPAAMAVVICASCNQPPAVNPWRDDSIPPSEYGTASSRYVRDTQAQPAIRTRAGMAPSQAPIASGAVAHYPLWWEDPFEDQGDKDGQFAWTWQDYLHMAYGPARLSLNTLAWPVSAVVTPPGTPMVSDGVVEKVHDAKVGRSSNPNATLDDFMAENSSSTATPVAAPATAPGS